MLGVVMDLFMQVFERHVGLFHAIKCKIGLSSFKSEDAERV